MKTLIVYAHPDTGDHCREILKRVIAFLDSNKQSYDLLDLYKMNYDPVLSKEEHYTQNTRDISIQNKSIQKMIQDSDNLIFIYPIWWGTMPAILKGFFDRVLTPGFAYKYEKNKPVGLLKGKKAAVIITHGASKIIYSLIGNPQANTIKYLILRFCGIKSKVFQIDRAKTLDQNQIQKIENQVSNTLNYLF